MVRVNGVEVLNADKLFTKSSILYRRLPENGRVIKNVSFQLPLDCTATYEFLKNIRSFRGEFEVEDSLVKVNFFSDKLRFFTNIKDGCCAVRMFFKEIEIVDKQPECEATGFIKIGNTIYQCSFDEEDIVRLKYTNDGKLLETIAIRAIAKNRIKDFFEGIIPHFNNSAINVELGDSEGVFTNVGTSFQFLRYYFDFSLADSQTTNLLIEGSHNYAVE